MNKVIDKGCRSCRFVSTIVKHPVYLYDIKFGMLQVSENELSLGKWSCGTAHLRSCAP